jgi:hypothetical protein
MGAVLGFEYAPEYAELVRRIFHGDAPGGVVPAGITLASDRPEWAILRSEILWDVTGSIGALAANFSGLALRQGNPNRISVVEEIWVCNNNAAAQAYRIALSFSLPTPIGTTKSLARDGRRGSSFQPSTTVITYQDAVGFLLTRPPFTVPGLTALILKPSRAYIVQPSLSNAVPTTNLIVQNNVVNQDCVAYFFGYERLIRPEEKTDS